MKNFKEIKAMRNMAEIIALMAVIVFMAAGCRESPGNDPIPAIYNLIATAVDGSGKKQVLNFNITSINRSAKAINITGASTYEVLLADTVISAGTVTVSGGVYTFTPNGGGSPFSFNTNTMNQKIVFSGDTYKLYYDNVISETGTFMFTENVGGAGNYDNTFIFFRKGQGTTTAAYLWEGQNKPADGNPAFLELYNHFYDPMEIAKNLSSDEPGSPAAFVKKIAVCYLYQTKFPRLEFFYRFRTAARNK